MVTLREERDSTSVSSRPFDLTARPFQLLLGLFSMNVPIDKFVANNKITSSPSLVAEKLASAQDALERTMGAVGQSASEPRAFRGETSLKKGRSWRGIWATPRRGAFVGRLGLHVKKCTETHFCA